MRPQWGDTGHAQLKTEQPQHVHWAHHHSHDRGDTIIPVYQHLHGARPGPHGNNEMDEPAASPFSCLRAAFIRAGHHADPRVTVRTAAAARRPNSVNPSPRVPNAAGERVWHRGDVEAEDGLTWIIQVTTLRARPRDPYTHTHTEETRRLHSYTHAHTHTHKHLSPRLLTHPSSEKCVFLEGHFYTASRSSSSGSAWVPAGWTATCPPSRRPESRRRPCRGHGAFSRDAALKVTGASSALLCGMDAGGLSVCPPGASLSQRESRAPVWPHKGLP